MPAGAWIEIILYCRTPGFHKAITEVLIEKGRWQLADSENKDSERTPAKVHPSDIQRGAKDVYCYIGSAV